MYRLIHLIQLTPQHDHYRVGGTLENFAGDICRCNQGEDGKEDKWDGNGIPSTTRNFRTTGIGQTHTGDMHVFSVPQSL